MKRIKIALIAVMAILMGTTFTSCLNSDDSAREGSDIVSINYLGRVTSDNGYTLDIQNYADMQLSDNSYPARAIIAYTEIDGEDYTAGKTSYKVYFKGYYMIMYVGETSTVAVDKATSINALATDTWASGNYINVGFNMNYNDNTTPEEDFVLCLDKVSSNGSILYCKLVHRAVVESTDAKTGSIYMSFYLPWKSDLQDQFPELKYTGDDSSIIDIIVTAEGANGTELTSNQFKATLRN